jgi:hypothetical protein
MSLESVIAENTAAIRELIEAIKNGVPTTAAQVAAVATEAKADKPEKAKAEKKAEAPKREAEEQSAATPEQKAGDAAAEVTEADVKEVTIALGKAGKRDALVAKLEEYGVPRATALPEEQWAEYVAWARAQLDG